MPLSSSLPAASFRSFQFGGFWSSRRRGDGPLRLLQKCDELRVLPRRAERDPVGEERWRKKGFGDHLTGTYKACRTTHLRSHDLEVASNQGVRLPVDCLANRGEQDVPGLGEGAAQYDR